MKLWRLENAWAMAALSAMFPGSAEAGLEGIASMDVRAYLDDVMRTRPLRAVLGLRMAIWIAAFGPLLVLGRLTTLTRVSQADREQVLERLIAHRIYGVRMLVMLLKTFGALLYAGDERVRARVRPRRAGGSSRGLVSLRLRGSAP
jgi:hypothetical protein